MKSEIEMEFEDEMEDLPVLGPISAVVYSTDWTTETIVSQIQRGNIILNPKFQRRDAWSIQRKSLLIESLIVGLPVPQIVLAESNDARGKFIVLDGKQRLLTLLQFWGLAEGPNNKFSLSRLKLKPELSRRTYEEISSDMGFEEDFNSLANQSIRTMVIRNWESEDLLHQVFLRLNTGSVKLSPQELRQALHPGAFTSYVDEVSGDLKSLRDLLGTDQPDPRMRDVEILARHLAFRFYSNEYPGRMKEFLDGSFKKLNKRWVKSDEAVKEAVSDFDKGLKSLLDIFDGKPARKHGSQQFNRAIFDALIYYSADEAVRDAIEVNRNEVREVYKSLFEKGSPFVKSIESDTAGRPNTLARFKIWGEKLEEVTGIKVEVPAIPQGETDPS